LVVEAVDKHGRRYGVVGGTYVWVVSHSHVVGRGNSNLIANASAEEYVFFTEIFVKIDQCSQIRSQTGIFVSEGFSKKALVEEFDFFVKD
jgi:hypothetical protein